MTGHLAKVLANKVSSGALAKVVEADDSMNLLIWQLSNEEPSLHKHLAKDEVVGLLYRATMSAVSTSVSDEKILKEITEHVARLTLALAMSAVNDDREHRSHSR